MSNPFRFALRAALPPITAAQGAHQALLNVAGVSVRQGAFSMALVALGFGLAYATKAYVWMGLFGLLLLPLALVSIVVFASRAVLPASPSWARAWIILLGALGLSAWLTLALYRRWMNGFELGGLNDTQVLVCAIGFGALVLALPLWQAQSRARAWHLAGLQQASLVAELKSLQAQIEPHFLYNTLANTRYLARHDPEKAVQMLDHLIAYLHVALPDMRSASSTLGREFELAEHYLALMTIRFGERLGFTVDCPSELRSASLPPLMLMTLVENAVQHGVEPQPGPVKVSLTAMLTGAQLRIVVRDDGAGQSATALGNGVGLRNLRERLVILFGDGASFHLRMAQEQATEAELRLPFFPAREHPA